MALFPSPGPGWAVLRETDPSSTHASEDEEMRETPPSRKRKPNDSFAVTKRKKVRVGGASGATRNVVDISSGGNGTGASGQASAKASGAPLGDISSAQPQFARPRTPEFLSLSTSQPQPRTRKVHVAKSSSSQALVASRSGTSRPVVPHRDLTSTFSSPRAPSGLRTSFSSAKQSKTADTISRSSRSQATSGFQTLSLKRTVTSKPNGRSVQRDGSKSPSSSPLPEPDNLMNDWMQRTQSFKTPPASEKRRRSKSPTAPSQRSGKWKRREGSVNLSASKRSSATNKLSNAPFRGARKTAVGSSSQPLFKDLGSVDISSDSDEAPRSSAPHSSTQRLSSSRVPPRYNEVINLCDDSDEPPASTATPSTGPFKMLAVDSLSGSKSAPAKTAAWHETESGVIELDSSSDEDTSIPLVNEVRPRRNPAGGFDEPLRRSVETLFGRPNGLLSSPVVSGLDELSIGAGDVIPVGTGFEIVEVTPDPVDDASQPPVSGVSVPLGGSGELLRPSAQSPFGSPNKLSATAPVAGGSIGPSNALFAHSLDDILKSHECETIRETPDPEDDGSAEARIREEPPGTMNVLQNPHRIGSVPENPCEATSFELGSGENSGSPPPSSKSTTPSNPAIPSLMTTRPKNHDKDPDREESPAPPNVLPSGEDSSTPPRPLRTDDQKMEADEPITDTVQVVTAHSTTKVRYSTEAEPARSVPLISDCSTSKTPTLAPSSLRTSQVRVRGALYGKEFFKHVLIRPPPVRQKSTLGSKDGAVHISESSVSTHTMPASIGNSREQTAPESPIPFHEESSAASPPFLLNVLMRPADNSPPVAVDSANELAQGTAAAEYDIQVGEAHERPQRTSLANGPAPSEGLNNVDITNAIEELSQRSDEDGLRSNGFNRTGSSSGASVFPSAGCPAEQYKCDNDKHQAFSPGLFANNGRRSDKMERKTHDLQPTFNPSLDPSSISSSREVRRPVPLFSDQSLANIINQAKERSLASSSGPRQTTGLSHSKRGSVRPTSNPISHSQVRPEVIDLTLDDEEHSRLSPGLLRSTVMLPLLFDGRYSSGDQAISEGKPLQRLRRDESSDGVTTSPVSGVIGSSSKGLIRLDSIRNIRRRAGLNKRPGGGPPASVLNTSASSHAPASSQITEVTVDASSNSSTSCTVTGNSHRPLLPLISVADRSNMGALVESAVTLEGIPMPMPSVPHDTSTDAGEALDRVGFATQGPQDSKPSTPLDQMAQHREMFSKTQDITSINPTVETPQFEKIDIVPETPGTWRGAENTSSISGGLSSDIALPDTPVQLPNAQGGHLGAQSNRDLTSDDDDGHLPRRRLGIARKRSSRKTFKGNSSEIDDEEQECSDMLLYPESSDLERSSITRDEPIVEPRNRRSRTHEPSDYGVRRSSRKAFHSSRSSSGDPINLLSEGDPITHVDRNEPIKDIETSDDETLCGVPVLTWRAVCKARRFIPPYFQAKNLPHELHDVINNMDPVYRSSDMARIVFEATISDNTADDEPDAPTIQVINDIDDEPCPPWEFYYTNQMWHHDGVPRPDVTNLTGCDCEGRCDPKSKTCSCLMKQRMMEWKNGFMYNDRGRLKEESYPIFECNAFCGCDEDCTNRVVQHGRKCTVNIVKTQQKGWGVFAGNKRIPRGTFVGIYAGELLTDSVGEERGMTYDKFGRTYLFDLDFHYLKVTPEWEPRYTVDAYHAGNFTRFLNHSCAPNCHINACYINEANLEKPLLTIFTMEDVAPFEELCFSYYGNGEDDEEPDPSLKPGQVPMKTDAVHKPCRCRASNCRGAMWK